MREGYPNKVLDMQLDMSTLELRTPHPQTYHISNQVGSGASGRMLLAKGSLDRKLYVAKQIDFQAGNNEAALSYALHEARILFLLRHPRIVHLHDFYPQSSSIFLVLEYCEHGDLAKQIQQRLRDGGMAFDPETAIKWWYQLLDGLDFCHEHGVLHRDLKPSNLLLDSEFDLKLADFGVSSLIHSPPAPERVGSRRYMAPEVVEELKYSTKSDVWSAGIVMMEALTLKQHEGNAIDLVVLESQIGSKYGKFTLEGLQRQLHSRPEIRSEASEQKRFLLTHIPESLRHTVVKEIGQEIEASTTSANERVWSSSPNGKLTHGDEVDVWNGIGIALAPGKGGENGTWKIASVNSKHRELLDFEVVRGDFLWDVDGRIVYGFSFETVTGMLSGPVGSSVTIGIKKELSFPVKHFTLIRKPYNESLLQTEQEHYRVEDQRAEEGTNVASVSTSSCSSAEPQGMSQFREPLHESRSSDEDLPPASNGVRQEYDPTDEPISSTDVGGVTALSVGSASIAGGGRYIGQLRYGRPWGRGTASWPQQGHSYVGEWKDGVMHGQGSATYLNGDRYDGEWLCGKRSGLGRYSHGSGDVYEGLWSSEKKEGLGVDTFADGRGYRGELEENKYAGIGAYFSKDGPIYQGEWSEGKAHGQGISISSSKGKRFVRYSYGTIISSEPFYTESHGIVEEKIEIIGKAAIAVALLSRKVASMLQSEKLEPPLPFLEQLEGQALRECLSEIKGTSPLGEALHLLIGVRSVVQEDSSLVVQSHESDEETFQLKQGDIIHEVCGKSCSWYRELPIEDVLLHVREVQGPFLEMGIKTEGMPPWSKPQLCHVSLREAV